MLHKQQLLQDGHCNTYGWGHIVIEILYNSVPTSITYQQQLTAVVVFLMQGTW